MTRLVGIVMSLASVVTCCEGAPVPDLAPPQTLDVVLHLEGDRPARCADMGGTWNGQFTCHGVDY